MRLDTFWVVIQLAGVVMLFFWFCCFWWIITVEKFCVNDSLTCTTAGLTVKWGYWSDFTTWKPQKPIFVNSVITVLSLSLSLSLLLSLRVRSWLEMETEALGSEGGEQGDWTQSHVKGQRAASPQGAGSTTQRAGDGGSVGAGGATEEERPRWEPKLTAQTLLIHWGFGCLWPPGVYTHLSERSCQLNTVEPPQPQRAAHWAQKQQKKKKKEKEKTEHTQSSSDLWPTFNWYEAVFFRHISPDEISIDQSTFSQAYTLVIRQRLQNNNNNSRSNFTSG